MAPCCTLWRVLGLVGALCQLGNAAAAAAASSSVSSVLEALTTEELMALPKEQLVEAIVASRGGGCSENSESHVSNGEAHAMSPASLPGGSYQSSCYECAMDAGVLTCRCMGRGDLIPTALPATPNNLTGGWHSVGGPTTPDGGGTIQPARMRIQPADSGDFAVLCTDGGNSGECQSSPPPQFTDGWHTGSATVGASNATNFSFHLRSGQDSWQGTLKANGTRISWLQSAPGPPPPFPPGPPAGGPPPAWVRDGIDRVQPAGTLTSISISACHNSSRHAITNRDGFLSCTWTDKPPPRVGPLTNHDFNSSAKTCRYIHHTTFTSPRYSNDDTVLSKSALLEPQRHSTLAGTWSSLGNDGTYSDITLVVVDKNASEVESVNDDEGFSVTCTDAGPDDGCDPIVARHDTQGRTGGWHVAHGTVKGKQVSVTFDNSQSNTGILDANRTVIAWQDGSRWERKHPNQVGACCARCTATVGCRGWTISSNICTLVRSVGQHYPDPRAVSGYPLHSDAASFCTHGNDNRMVPSPWADSKNYPDISCSSIEPKPQPPPKNRNDSDVSYFPRSWSASTAGGQRGEAWLFYPKAWCAAAPSLCTSCSCHCSDAACDGAYCQGAKVSELKAKNVDIFKGKAWSVFVHGGEFHWNNEISGDYYALSTRVAEESGMGVLAVDYRTTASIPISPFPAAVEDVIAAMKWLKDQGVSKLTLHGDSSGGTQVVETLIYMEHLRSIGKDPGVTVDRALTFSCWLDLTSSTPTFFTRKWCTADCDGMGDPDNKNSPGWVMVKGQCAALEYAGKRPLNDPLISPLHADHKLIAKLPPLMMLIGGTEIILSDNIEFGQLAQGLGAPVQVEVFADMWHDFEQESEGCHSAMPLAEGKEALRLAGSFLSSNSTVHVVSRGQTSSPGAIRWHYSHNMWPPIGREECKCADC